MPFSPVIIIGIDPGLQKTGWGIIRQEGNYLSFIACGTINTGGSSQPLAQRLHHLNQELAIILSKYEPAQAAIEETFVNTNGQSTLKLGQARGAILLTLAQAELPIAEYAATLVKKTITGAGRAEKNQVSHMVNLLLPGCGKAEQMLWTRWQWRSVTQIIGNFHFLNKLFYYSR